MLPPNAGHQQVLTQDLDIVLLIALNVLALETDKKIEENMVCFTVQKVSLAI